MSIKHDFSAQAVAAALANITPEPLRTFDSARQAMIFSLGILDLTTLEGADTVQKVEALCGKASGYRPKGLPNVAAVCVYPVFARQVRSLLKDTDIRTACVAGAFPAGQSPIHIKVAEVKYAVEEGAEEIDMVISRGKFLEGRFGEVADEISAIKEACGNAHLKVILETGELNSLPAIYDASMMAMKAGGDFVKTSTGKVNPAATPEAAYAMLLAIRDYFEATGKYAGFKPAGGISTPEQALVYVKLVESILGPEWLNNKLFRIGASRLADNLAAELMKS